MADAPSTSPEIAASGWRKRLLTRTKTVATVGPASRTPDRLHEMLAAGVDVFRINMAHGTRADHQAVLNDIRDVCRETGMHAGVLIDLAGPKIRLGQLLVDPLELHPGDKVWFVRGDHSTASHELTCTYAPLVDEVSAGDRIVLSDGMIRLEVVSTGINRVDCRVVDGGALRSRQGVNLPGVRLGVTALSATDLDNALWAADNEVEFVSLSFVRRAAELEVLKSRLQERGSQAMVVAKIEKREALDNLESIVTTADAVMVARGDLGVEIDLEKTPLAQKQIIRTCARLGKPVIVATQMLESMHTNRHPTRAEVSDVANAILDGADACMLSGETAIGEFPVEAVLMMRRIQAETETALEGRPSRDYSRERTTPCTLTESVVFGAAAVARRANASLVVIATATAQAAILKSKQRDFIPVIGVTDQPQIANRMCLLWGITPVLAPTLDPVRLTERVRQWISDHGYVHSGDCIVLVVDSEFLPGVHDTIMVWTEP